MDPRRLLSLNGIITTRSRSGVADDLGDRSYTVLTRGPYKCWIWQTRRYEDTVNQDTQAEDYGIAIELAAAGQFTGGDAITIQNVVYEFDGPPWDAFHPLLRRVTHIEATLKRVGQTSIDEGGASATVETLTGEPMGYPNLEDTTISFDATSRTFTLAPTGDLFEVYVRGKRFVINEPRSITLPPETSPHYIVLDEYAQLQTTGTIRFDFETEAPTAFIYWNADTGRAEIFADERHGIVMDWQTHEYLHRTRGAALANGFVASNFTTTGNGSLDSDAQLDIGNGTFFDEDLEVIVTHSATPSAPGQQILQGGAELPIYYRIDGAWRSAPATKFPMLAGPSRPYYNQLNNGTASLVEVGQNRYSSSWIIATNDIRHPIICLMGQQEYVNINQARNLANEDLTGLPIVEFRPLFEILWQASSNYANTIKARIVDVIDLREFETPPEAIIP
jgi:hypothetical protein